MTVIEKLDMNVKQANSDFQAIKNKIAEKGVTIDDGTKTSEYASKVDEVYDAGKQAEWSAFWDEFQRNGTRTSYNRAFRQWTDAMFKPKYDICPTAAEEMFQGSNIKDLVGTLNRAGAVLDFSQCKNMKMAFYTCVLENIPTIDTTATTNNGESGTFYYLFANNTSLISIEKIILKSDGSQSFNNAFNYTPKLQEVRFEGVIGQNGLSFSGSSTLSKESFISVINCLSDTTSGLSVTFSKTARTKAFTDEEWAALIATKPNWTISLV